MSIPRSVLYIAAGSRDGADRAVNAAPDAVIIDLEDAVSAAEKDLARGALGETVDRCRSAIPTVAVRINHPSTSWSEHDVDALGSLEIDAVVLPKCEGPSEVTALAHRLPAVRAPIWAMMESPAAVDAAGVIAAHAEVVALVVGTADLLKSLGLPMDSNAPPLLAACEQVVAAARAAGKPAFDGVYLGEREGFTEACVAAATLGFAGKTLLFPGTVETCNEVFARLRVEAHPEESSR